jgi:hypothetical protein
MPGTKLICVFSLAAAGLAQSGKAIPAPFQRWQEQVAEIIVKGPQDGNPGRIGGGFSTLRAGITVRYATVAEPPLHAQNNAGHGSGSKMAGSRLQRYEVDGGTNSFFGYDLVVDPAPGGRFRVAFEPLSLRPQDLPERIRSKYPNLIAVSLPKYPPSQVIEDGDTIALDLLISPDGQRKVVDYIQVASSLSGPGPAAPGSDTGAEEPKDFAVSDVTLNVAAPLVWLVNGQEVRRLMTFRPAEGSALWLYFPGRGRFVLSLLPLPGYDFRKAGAIRNRVISFRWNNSDYEVRTAAPILGERKVWNLYVLADPSYQPAGLAAGVLSGGTDRIEKLLPKR